MASVSVDGRPRRRLDRPMIVERAPRPSKGGRKIEILHEHLRGIGRPVADYLEVAVPEK